MLDSNTVFVEVNDDPEKDNQKSMAFIRVMKNMVQKVWFLRFIVILILLRSEDKYLSSNPEEVNLWFIIFELVSGFGKYNISVCTAYNDISHSFRISWG